MHTLHVHKRTSLITFVYRIHYQIADHRIAQTIQMVMMKVVDHKGSQIMVDAQMIMAVQVKCRVMELVVSLTSFPVSLQLISS